MSKNNPPSPESIPRLVGRLLIALPPLYALWYFGAPIIFAPMAPILETMLHLLMPGIVEGVHLIGHRLTFETLLPIQSRTGEWGSATFNVDMLIYTFSLPTLLSMLWAAKALSRPFRTIALAYALLFPAWLWGMGFWFAKTAIFNISEEATKQVGILGFGLELVGLGYQFGTLILPSLSVVLIWVWLCPEQMNRLIGVVAPRPTKVKTNRRKSKAGKKRR